ncbi:MAG: hypothetical protein AB1454_00735 [Candidatus Auribacterota bacterium]|jgi:hypothetical protein
MLKQLMTVLDSLMNWKILCDTCKYDYGNACSRPDRPNARKCPDYKRR